VKRSIPCAAFAIVLLLSCSALSQAGSTTTRSHAVHTKAASAAYIYAANDLTTSPPYVGSVVYYPVGSNGNVAPAGMIAGSNTMLTQVDGIVVDQRGFIWVADSDTNMILAFAPGSTGNVAPQAVISGPATGLASPVALAIDSSDNIYVANCAICGFGPPGVTSVEEFAAGSNGDVTPMRVIAGRRTQLEAVEGIALDEHGFIYVANSFTERSVTVFGPNAHGNAPPKRVLNTIGAPVGLAVIGSHLFVTSVWTGQIVRFARRASGNASPHSTFSVQWSGNASGQSLSGIAAAPDGSLYVAGYSAPLIAQFAATATGRAAPLSQIEGSNTGLVLPAFVFVR
jgi:hypothetical protein